jgi:hypothetical protein
MLQGSTRQLNAFLSAEVFNDVYSAGRTSVYWRYRFTINIIEFFTKSVLHFQKAIM